MTQTTVALSDISTRDGFNPRTDIERKELESLARSIKQRGLLQPLVVTPADCGFHLIDGHRRFAAAAIADLGEVPVIVRDSQYQGADDVEAEQLIDAVTANAQRVDLTVLDEAKAYGRLRDAGYHVRQIATELGVSQKHVTARLKVLELPGEVQGMLANGLIGPGFVDELVKAAKVHPSIACAIAAGVAADAPTLSDFSADPLDYCDPEELDEGCWLVRGSVRTADVPLSELAQGLVNEANALTTGNRPLDWIWVDEGLLEQGVAAGVVYAPDGIGEPGKRWTATKVVVADAEWMGFAVEQTLHGEVERLREAARSRVGVPEPVEDQSTEDLSPEELEERAKAQRKAEREAELKARDDAHARNMTLGATLQQKLTGVELSRENAVALAALVLRGGVEDLAAAGAAYCLSQLQTEETQKNGRIRRSYNHDQARGWVRGYILDDGTGEQVIARLTHVLAMAAFADQDVVARSNRLGCPAPADRWQDAIAQLAAGALPEFVSPEPPSFRVSGLTDAPSERATHAEPAAESTPEPEGSPTEE